MTQAPNARVENLIYTLKELQNEKVGLEQKLQEQELKRRSLEQSLEQETSKCSHVQDKHRRMAGTFAVAQQKVDMTMSTCASLQEEIDKRKPELQKNQEAIEEEKELQRETINKFETALSSISSELFHARDFYKKAALHNEINQTKKAHQDLELKAEKDKREIQKMNRILENLVQERDGCVKHNFGCENALYACYSAMERDKQEAKEYRNRVRAELKEIQDILNAEN